MNDLQLMATQTSKNPVYYNNDQNRLLVNFESVWNEGEYSFESIATLDLTSGEIEVISGMVTDDAVLNQLNHLDSESIIIDGIYMDAEYCSVSQENLNVINMGIAECNNYTLLPSM